VCITSLAHGNDCSSAESSFDPTCPAKQPFCRTTSTTLTASKTCVECRSDCDCDVEKFCSMDITGNTLGQCLSFDPEGKSCYPISTAQHYGTDVDNSKKCSMTMDLPAPQGKAMNHQGSCIEGTCRFCNPGASSAGTIVCQGGEYLGPSRVCVWPGVYQTRHSQNWEPGLYFEEPLRVWLAVFFVFILFICLAQVCGCAHTTKKNYMK